MIGMLDTAQIVRPFNTLWSHNVAHSCDHVTFNVDCCYDILQHLLRIRMSITTSGIFQSIRHQTSSQLRNMLQLFKNNSFL